MEVGVPLGLKPGHTSSIRRIEAGMLSYHADMTLNNNPFEMGMDRLVDLDMAADFISKAALARIKEQGITQRFVGLEITGEALVGSNDENWPVMRDGRKIGYITSAIHSPRLKKNIALAMLENSQATIGNSVTVDLGADTQSAEVVPIPFHDPKKAIAAKS